MDKTQTDKYIKLGLNIHYYRKIKGYTQNEFAEMIDVERTYISRVELGKASASLGIIFRIADALGVAESKLFEFRE